MSTNPPSAETAKHGERAFVEQLRRMLPPQHGAAVPFGDDMAEIPECNLLSSVDMLMDGVDFRSAEHDWRRIGFKALAVNLSDCAAMAARPLGALVAVALADDLSTHAALDLHQGCIDCGATFDCRVLGGDTNVWSHPTAISVTVFATLDGRPPVLRSHAQPGDLVFLSGPVGGSLLGRHLTPNPRIKLAIRTAESLDPRAMIDISDGLAIDLDRICTASQVGAVLDVAALEPAIHPDAVRRSAQTGSTPLQHALYDGEDFELIVVVDPRHAAAAAALGLIQVGAMEAAPGLRLREATGAQTTLAPRGWEHGV